MIKKKSFIIALLITLSLVSILNFQVTGNLIGSNIVYAADSAMTTDTTFVIPHEKVIKMTDQQKKDYIKGLLQEKVSGTRKIEVQRGTPISKEVMSEIICEGIDEGIINDRNPNKLSVSRLSLTYNCWFDLELLDKFLLAGSGLMFQFDGEGTYSVDLYYKLNVGFVLDKYKEILDKIEKETKLVELKKLFFLLFSPDFDKTLEELKEYGMYDEIIPDIGQPPEETDEAKAIFEELEAKNIVKRIEELSPEYEAKLISKNIIEFKYNGIKGTYDLTEMGAFSRINIPGVDIDDIATAYRHSRTLYIRYIDEVNNYAVRMNIIIKYVNNSISVVNFGDLNGDGNINAGDLTLLRRYILNIIDKFPYENGFKNADINEDGRINSGDYTLLIRIILS